MEENSQQQAASSSPEMDMAALSSLQEKRALLSHLLKHFRKPIDLLGSQEEQAGMISLLQKEAVCFHSVAAIRPHQETTLPYVLGLLFHLLSISEQEVAGSDPEHLLARHLGRLEKKSQLLLLLVNPASELEREQKELLIELVQKHPALRLVFAWENAHDVESSGEESTLFYLSEPGEGGFRRADRDSPEGEAKCFKLTGAATAFILAAILVGSFFLPTAVDQKNALEVVESDPVAAQQQPDTTGLEPPLLPEEEPEPPVAESVEQVSQIPDVSATIQPISAIEEPEPDTKVADSRPEEPVINEGVEPIEKTFAEGPALENEAMQPVKAVESAQERVKVAVQPVVEATAAPQATDHQEEWLLNQKKDRFTLQIMGGSERASIASYVKRQQDRAPFAYYRSIKKGKSWFPLLYGVYPSKEAAKRAVNRLPQGLQKLKPWARSLETIQAEIREAMAMPD